MILTKVNQKSRKWVKSATIQKLGVNLRFNIKSEGQRKNPTIYLLHPQNIQIEAQDQLSRRVSETEIRQIWALCYAVFLESVGANFLHESSPIYRMRNADLYAFSSRDCKYLMIKLGFWTLWNWQALLFTHSHSRKDSNPCLGFCVKSNWL